MSKGRTDEGQYGARRRALAAARDVLRHRSYGSFSVEHVAKAAGLSRRTLYNQFEDRAELYRLARMELVAELEGVLPREIDCALPIGEAVEQFVCDASVALAGDAHGQLRAAVGRDGAELPWLAAIYRERVIQPLEWAVERFLLQHAHGRSLTVDEPVTQARRLVAMVMAAVAEPTAFHPAEITAIFLERLERPSLQTVNSSVDLLPVRPSA